MGIGSGLARLDGYPFDVRYSDGALVRATAAADVAAAAYTYFDRLFAGVEPDIALIVADPTDWLSRQPYGLPFFNDDPGQIRPGVVVMSAGSGDFWSAIVQDLRDASPGGYPKLLETYPDGAGGVDLQPFFDLITIHELGHAFERLGDLRLPASWLSEIFVNLAMHAFVATQMPASLPTLEVLATVGAASRTLAVRMRAEGYSTLEELDAHYTGGDQPMSPLNYVWFQYRWQRLAAKMFQVDGEDGLAVSGIAFTPRIVPPPDKPQRHHWPRCSDRRSAAPSHAQSAIGDRGRTPLADSAPRRTLSQHFSSVASAAATSRLLLRYSEHPERKPRPALPTTSRRPELRERSDCPRRSTCFCFSSVRPRLSRSSWNFGDSGPGSDGHTVTGVNASSVGR